MSDVILVFTDWDGVLVHPAFMHTVPTEKYADIFNSNNLSADPIDPVSFGLLNRLFFERPELNMVCSSTWRADGRENLEQGLKDAHASLSRALNTPDLPYAIRFHDIPGEPDSWRTDFGLDTDMDLARGKAIDQYLIRYCDPNQKYIILDDDADFEAHQKSVLIRMNGYRGFGIEEFIQAEDLIGAMRFSALSAPQKPCVPGA
ncbi:MAG: hypothetical protein CMH27_08660 [Micavibrio sp.]|nr:hypothetical protein [Micavibrio sp.]|tara:strand:- start:497 stop:1105 length:609 start_codon:yes stop_codon:yes gene_type:complete